MKKQFQMAKRNEKNVTSTRDQRFSYKDPPYNHYLEKEQKQL